MTSTGRRTRPTKLLSPTTTTAALCVLVVLGYTASAVSGDGLNEPQIRKPIDCSNLADGNYVWGCSRAYSMCSNNAEIPSLCPGNHVLNPETNECVQQRDNPICTLSETKLYKAKEQFNCAQASDGLYPVREGACSNFYISCQGGVRRDMPCPGTLLFDAKSKSCDHAENCQRQVKARRPGEGLVVIDQGHSQQQAQQQGGRPQGSYNPRRGGVYHPDVQDTFAQPAIQSGQAPPVQPSSYSQPQPSPVNPATQQRPTVTASGYNCVGKAEGVYLVNPRDCTDKFWKCAHEVAFNYTCPAGLFYNIETNECDYRQYIRACGGQPTTTTPPPTQTSPPIDYDCSGKPDGFYAPIPCHSEHISCVGGRPIDRMTCPAGTVFDSITSQCDWPAACGTDRESSTSGSPQQQQPAPTGSSGYSEGGYRSNRGMAATSPSYPTTPSQPPYGQQQSSPPVSQSPPTAAPVNYNCVGKPDGNYAQQQCQSQYITCVNGVAVQTSCPAGTVYDSAAGSCDYPASCGIQRPTTPPQQQQQQQTSSSGYGSAPPTSAQTTQPAPAYSTPAATQQTAYTQPAPYTPPVPASSSPAQPQYDCASKQDGVYLTNPGACTTQFWKCANGATFNYNCPPELFYNIENNQCDYRHAVRACGGNSPQPSPPVAAAPPPPSTAYGVQQPQQQQQQPALVPAPAPVSFNCVGKRDGHYVQQQCQPQYIICANGVAAQVDCPAGTVFDSATGACEWPSACGNQRQPVQPAQQQVAPAAGYGPPPVAPVQSPPVASTPAPYVAPAQPAPVQQPPPPPPTYQQQPYSVQSQAPQAAPVAQAQPPLQPQYNCVSKPDGVYLTNTAECVSHFWKCASGVAYRYDCPPGTVYNIENNQCDYRHAVRACGGSSPQPSPPVAAAPPPTTASPAPAYGPQQSQQQRPVAPVAAVPSFNCVGKPTGYYSHQPCQPQYYSCNAGIATQASCPSGTVFDQAVGRCDYPEACGTQRPTPPPISKQQPQAVPSSPLDHGSSNYYFPATQPQQQTPPVTTPVPPSKQHGFSCAGLRDGYYYQDPCTSTFVVCSAGQVSKQTCPNGLVFDPQIVSCEYASECGKPRNNSRIAAPGGYSTTPQQQPYQQPSSSGINTPVNRPSTPSFDCRNKADGYYSQYPCSDTFYTCASGHTIQLGCPPTLVYDAVAKKCEFPNLCSRGGASTPPSSASAPPASTVSSGGYGYGQQQPTAQPQQAPQAVPAVDFDCTGKPDGFYHRQTCQPKYYVCTAGKAIQSNCPAGTVFDGVAGRCDYESVCGKPMRPPPSVQVSTQQQQPPSAYGPPVTTTAPPPPPPTYQPPVPTASYQPTPPPTPSPITPPAVAQQPPPVYGQQPQQQGSAVGFSCAGRQDGYYIRNPCSALFFTCQAGVAAQFACPGTLRFDTNTGMCEYPHMCGKIQASPPTTPPTPQQAATVVASTPAPTPNFDCSGKADGWYEQGRCQNTYVRCAQGRAYGHSCDAQLVYIGATQMCDYRVNCERPQPVQSAPAAPVNASAPTTNYQQSAPAGTPYRSAQRPSAAQPIDQVHHPNCGNVPAGNHAAGECSIHYTTCWKGQLTKGSCFAGLFYNPTNGFCDFHWNVQGCRQAPPASAQQPQQPQQPAGAYSSHQPLQTSSNWCAENGKKEGVHGHGCHHSFYACSNGQTHLMSCPLGLFYDHDQKQCDLTAVITACGGTRPPPQQRPPARRPIQRQPPDFDCSHRANGIYSSGCSHRYYSCNGGQTFALECPSGTKYSQTTDRCDYHNNVPECGGAPPTTPAPVTPPPSVAAVPGGSPAYSNAPATTGYGSDGVTPVSPVELPVHVPIVDNPAPQPGGGQSASGSYTHDSTAVEVSSQPGGNPCQNLANGIYGRPCSRYYFVCSGAKTFDFICPEHQAFNVQQAKCWPREQVLSCKGQINTA